MRRILLVVITLVVSLAGCGGGGAPRGGFIQMNRAPDEWFQAFAAGAQKLGCEFTDKSNDPDLPPGDRMMWARCADRQLDGTMIDANGGTSAMCYAMDKRKVSDVECADFIDAVMNAGRAP